MLTIVIFLNKIKYRNQLKALQTSRVNLLQKLFILSQT